MIINDVNIIKQILRIWSKVTPIQNFDRWINSHNAKVIYSEIYKFHETIKYIEFENEESYRLFLLKHL